MSIFRNGGIAAGKRLEVFRETVGIPLYEPRKGWLPVGKRVYPGTERGTAAGAVREILGSAPYSSLA
ncbi:hypothetical protein ACOYF2_18735 [Salmonella enterica subsp. enterica]|uniref:hypothetical protein n=1 Tax=Salmonella enterica TaxID=28901 RepID=UPI00073555CF|nr:hypothetical protein [Salmonella enterica]EBS6317995.1 hypothetical protein [Salmonella enterica subsp. enterica serovar Weltevreden]ECC3629673.1 hypothetical protein [Salmonella enterica subsp. enterica]EDQ4533669.1 hypothetical protein [Salmonella enterica subsp. enterica serovar 4,[5],12:i:-]KTI04868.1 hypothetical protein ASV13_10945 [Enterobacter hormaechei subsp. steigerwaltii]ODW00076.1 hypothetical protein QS15_23490 [Salmonella enterica subsp. enterica serovar Anatum]HAA1131796.1 